MQHPDLWPASGVAGWLADRACAPADSLGAVQGRGAAEEVEAGGGYTRLGPDPIGSFRVWGPRELWSLGPWEL